MLIPWPLPICQLSRLIHISSRGMNVCASDTVTKATYAYKRLRVSYFLASTKYLVSYHTQSILHLTIHTVCLQQFRPVLVAIIPEDGHNRDKPKRLYAFVGFVTASNQLNAWSLIIWNWTWTP
jgi:hypothetical protein